MGSPPPAGSKKEVLKFRSISNIVIPPAKTGKAKSNKIAVIKTDHTNRGIFSKFNLGVRILIIVEIKLIAPRIEEIPATWREKIVKSTLDLLCAKK
jgi:hypothetical protein